MQPQPLYPGNEQRPFESHEYVLVKDSSKRKVHIDVRDTDMVLLVEVDRCTIHILHLYHVRGETVTAAQAAIDFLDQLKSIHDIKTIDRKMEFNISGFWDDRPHDDAHDFIRAQAEKPGLLFDWTQHSWAREAFRDIWQQPRFVVSLWKDGTSRLSSGNRPVFPETDRILPDAHGRLNVQVPAWATSNDGQ